MLIGRPKSEIEARSKIINGKFSRVRQRPGLHDRLRQRFSGLCIICQKSLDKKPTPDAFRNKLVVDHIIAVYVWAESYLPIERACEYANAETNLALVHHGCNTRKGSVDLEEFLETTRRSQP